MFAAESLQDVLKVLGLQRLTAGWLEYVARYEFNFAARPLEDVGHSIDNHVK